MADDQTPKRPHYFKSQFLVLRDFDDEQTYHTEMLRRHNRGLHGWGAVRGGLQVTAAPDQTGLLITPGSAVDNLGRDVALDAGAVLFFQNNDRQLTWNATASAYELPSKDVAAAAGVTGNPLDVYVTISFQESNSDDPDDQYPPPGGTVDVTRVRQTPLLKVEKTPADDGSSIKLARVNVDVGGKLGAPDMSARQQAGCFGPLFLTSGDGKLQFGIDYDPQSDALRVRARTKDAPALDAAHLTIQRGTGSVGIGATNPKARLDVSGGGVKIGAASDVTPAAGRELVLSPISGTSAGIVFQHNNVDTVFLKSDSGTRLTTFGANAGTSLAIDNKTGNVGIGMTTTPGFPLSFPNTLGDKIALWGQSGNTYGFGMQGALLQIHTDTSAADVAFGYGSSASLTELMRIKGTGNVGLGTASPGGNINTGPYFKADPAGRILEVYSPDHEPCIILSTNQNQNGAHLGGLYFTRTGGQADAHREVAGIEARQVGTGSGAGSSLYFFTKLNSGGISTDAARMAINESGLVGIGTTSPGSNLHLNVPSSSSAISAVSIDVQSFNTTANAQASHFFRVRDIGGSATPFYIRGDGLVGIGTTAPLGPLTIGNASVDGSDGFIVFGKKSGGSTRQYRMGFDKDFNFVIGDYGYNNVAAATWTAPFAVRWSAPSYSLYIDADGRVGMGTSNLSGATLTVLGYGGYGVKIGSTDLISMGKMKYGGDSIIGTSNLWLDAANTVYLKKGYTSPAYDLAESFDTAEPVAPGDVVVFDEQENAVRLCVSEGDSCVIGIASTDPASIMGIGDGSSPPIALCGRVPCNVDADIAPIRAGDLLTTSPTKGHAQKVLDAGKAAGAIIGKALGSLEKGRGQITVLVALA